MMLRDSQTFLSLYCGPNAVEIATGGADSFKAAETWQRETKQLGQVATPAPIAKLMAKWVMSGMPKTVLDPAAGLGGLLAECCEINPRVVLVGVEQDTDTLQRAKASAPRGAKLILADYLKSDAGLFDGIIANPPYVKAQRLSYSEEDWHFFEERFGTRLDRLTNLYALFLLKIWEDLAPNGRAAVIVPAEVLNANFGDEIKERIAHIIRPVGIAVFPPTVNIFENALTTSIILFFEKGRPSDAPSTVLRVESVKDAECFVDALVSRRTLPHGKSHFELSTLNPRAKWLNVVLGVKRPTDSIFFSKRVGDYFACRRGIATGANDYFCLSRGEMSEHGLMDAHVEPCITKAVDADGLVFTRIKFQALSASNRRCFLLSPSANCPAVGHYLKLGEQRGIPRRHLPSHRPIWYLPENRAVANIWVAVFSRESVKFILNSSDAKNLTCFHGLYARSGSETLAALMTLFLNSSAGRLAFSQVNRFYGGGLNKLEPKDVEEMPCPAMPRLSGSGADELARKLARLEKLSPTERLTCVDGLLARYIPSNSPQELSSSQQHRDQNPHLAGQHTRRGAQVP